MAGIISSTLLPRSWSSKEPSLRTPPGPVGRNVGSFFVGLSKRACLHPIYTIVSVAILASTTYLGLLENSLFDRRISANNAVGRIDLNNILTGSKKLYVGAETEWKWSADEKWTYGDAEDHLALVTLVFPDSAKSSYKAAPQPRAIIIPSNSSAKSLPTSPNLLSPISYDYTLAFSVPFTETTDFLSSMKELCVAKDASQIRYLENHGVSEEKKWIMRAVRNPASSGFRHAAYESWTDFLDLLKNADTLDIGIMLLGYLAMYVTFFSLFLALRDLGSKFWLGFTVLLSGVFALLFGMTVTTKLGIPLNMVLLSEGLPFLVVTIGFEKPIHLTKAVLAASINKKAGSPHAQGPDSMSNLPSIQRAVQIAVREHGWIIVRDYLVEIAILGAGAFSGVQGGLRQFCFLACWILFFDCILLFTFFTAILTVKLEINRIKRHVELRKALEEDGSNNVSSVSIKTTNASGHRRTNEVLCCIEFDQCVHI